MVVHVVVLWWRLEGYGHVVALMAGAAAYGPLIGGGVGIVNLRHIFLVDLAGHRDHGAGGVLFRLCVGGEVGMLSGLIDFVTEGAMHAERLRVAVHDLHELVRCCVLGQHLEVDGLRQGLMVSTAGGRRRGILAEERAG